MEESGMTHPDPKNFYIGREYDLKSGKVTGPEVMYNPSDLTTHAVVTGMTGSGKTGLCVGLLEEAALKGLPAIIIDPKGDLTNLVLHFPGLAPSDFEPWIDPDAARLKGKTPAQMAEESAQSWSASIDEWSLGRDALSYLKDFSFAVYSPGSSSGIPVNILSSFEAPEIPWEGNEEPLRERISSTVTAVLGLVGMKDIDPLRSREHILMSSILEHAWARGEGLSLEDLILHVQKPQMERLGAFPVEKFFPEKEGSTAMLLNNSGIPVVPGLAAGPAAEHPGAPVHEGRQAKAQHLLPCAPERERAHVLRYPPVLFDRVLDEEAEGHKWPKGPGLLR